MAHAGVGLSLSVFVALFAQKLDGLAEFLLRDRARVVRARVEADRKLRVVHCVAAVGVGEHHHADQILVAV